MIDIYFTRHGQTIWNTEFRMQGRSNSPLTSFGIDGALTLGESLSKITPQIGKCYASPMPRALHTAKLIRESSLLSYPIEIDELLTEMDLGSWEGILRDEVKEKFPEEFINFRTKPERFVPIDKGETFHDVYRRAEAFLNKLRTEYLGKTPDHSVLLVSHMILVQAMLSVAIEHDVSYLRSRDPIPGTTLYGIRIEDEPSKYKLLMGSFAN